MLISYISNPTFATHLYMLGQLLALTNLGSEVKSHATTLSDILLQYVVATSCRKMEHRLNDRSLSRPYINSLEQVKISFCEPPKEPPVKDKEIDNDRQFLAWMYQYTLSNDQFGELCPLISHQAKLAHDGKPFQLYSRDTHKEFHFLLVLFLRNFRESLMKLSKSSSTALDETLLQEVVLYGRVLQKLSKSAALQAHLLAIHPILLFNHRLTNASTSESMSVVEAADEAQNGECDEKDEELQAVQPFVVVPGVDPDEIVTVPLWKSYRNWLRLLVVHFDAVDILVRHFARSRSPVSLQILTMPRVDTALLTMTKLIKSAHFPTNTVDSSVTNDGILKFIQEAISAHNLAWEITKKLKSSPNLSRRSKFTICNNLDKLSRLDTQLWSKDCLRISREDFDMEWANNPESLQTKITEKVESIIEATKLFEEKSFSGTCHCEACIASLLGCHGTADVACTAEFACTLDKMKVGDTVAT
jgi:hypothetical protein